MTEEKNLQENEESEESGVTEENLKFEDFVKNILKNLITPDEKTMQNLKELIWGWEGLSLNIVCANNVQGSSFFSNVTDEESEKTKVEQEYCLTREEDFLLFMREKKNSCLKLYLLILLGVRVLETSNLNYYTEQIRQHIGWNEEEPTEDMDLPFSEVCCLLKVEQMGILKRTRAGMMTQEAIGYNEYDIRILRKVFWKNYVNLREPLIQWLAEVNEGKQYPGAVLAGIGLADFAQIDFAFVYDRVMCRENKFYSEAQIYCMKRIVENAWKEERYHDNITHLLHYWLDQGKSQSWLVSLVCYLSNTDIVEQDKIKECLKRKIKNFSIEQKWAGFLILAAHQNPALCYILYDALAVLYTNAESKNEKEQVCLQFLTMLFVESSFASEKKENLTFIQVLGKKECISEQRPMMLLIWRTLVYRRLLQSILDRYFNYLPTGFDKTNLKSVLAMLAFTGKRADFENMMVYLKRESGCNNMVIKEQLYSDFQEILLQRKKMIGGKVTNEENI